MPTRPRISPAAFSLVQQGLHDAGWASRDLDRLVSLQPCGHIAGAAFDRSLGFESREPLFIEIFLATSLAPRERNYLRDWGVAIVHEHCAACADVIEIARKAVSELRDFGFFHDSRIIAKLALSGYEVDAASANACVIDQVEKSLAREAASRRMPT